MRLQPLEPRQNCPAGRQFYVCAAPHFKGCCSVDACANLGCPDEATEQDDDDRSSTSSTSRPSQTAATTSPSTQAVGSTAATPSPATVTSQAASTLTVTDSPSHASLHTTTVTSIGSGGTVTQTVVETDAASTQLADLAEITSSSNSNVGYIVGPVVGVVVMLIALSLLYICCWRPRRARKKARLRHGGSSVGSWGGSGDYTTVKEEKRGLLFSVKRFLGQPTSMTRRLTTASEVSWLDKSSPYASGITAGLNQKTTGEPDHASFGGMPQSPGLPDYTQLGPSSAVAAAAQPELDSRPISNLFELPGSTPGVLPAATDQKRKRLVELADSEENVRRSSLGQARISPTTHASLTPPTSRSVTGGNQTDQTNEPPPPRTPPVGIGSRSQDADPQDHTRSGTVSSPAGAESHVDSPTLPVSPFPPGMMTMIMENGRRGGWSGTHRASTEPPSPP